MRGSGRGGGGPTVATVGIVNTGNALMRKEEIGGELSGHPFVSERQLLCLQRTVEEVRIYKEACR